jgi:hypothetical protein
MRALDAQHAFDAGVGLRLQIRVAHIEGAECRMNAIRIKLFDGRRAECAGHTEARGDTAAQRDVQSKRAGDVVERARARRAEALGLLGLRAIAIVAQSELDA